MTPAHVILSTKTLDMERPYHPSVIRQLQQDVAAEKAVLRQGPIFDADEVADYFTAMRAADMAAGRMAFDQCDAVPNAAPPFAGFAVQFTMDGVCWVIPIRVTETDTVSGASKLGDLLIATGAQWPELKSARWVFDLTMWQVVKRKPRRFMLADRVAVAGDGRIVGVARSASLPGVSEAAVRSANHNPISVALLAIAFAHCKNVAQLDVSAKVNPLDQTLRKMKWPRLVYRRLAIDPMREVLRTEGQSAEVGLKRALHICRGHFAVYPNGLFNRTPGQPQQVFIPQHVRGKAENGMVLKDYAVKAPAAVG